MIVPRYFDDLGVLHEHTLPPRAYYVPASHPLSTSVWKREDSDRFHLLNGTWAFKYLPSIYELTEPFWDHSPTTSAPDGFQHDPSAQHLAAPGL